MVFNTGWNRKCSRRFFIRRIAGSTVCLIAGGNAGGLRSQAQETFSPFDNLNAALSPIREKGELPALAVAVMKNNKLAGAGAVGVRKAGGSDAVTLQDKFHIGSCTKSMTATLAAMLVEEGKISWDTTVGEMFPEWAGTIHSDYKTDTLDWLLSNRGGTPTELKADGLWGALWARSTETPVNQRLFLARNLLSKPPAARPGTKFIYSNAGFAIGGTMLEKKMGKPWETLITERLFAPLKMSSAGFGMPASRGKVDQPWGHRIQNDKTVPFPPGPGDDNPAAIGPAGIVHCSVIDFAKYTNLHVQGQRGNSKLLKKETFIRLHAPQPGQEYARGWFVVNRGWAHGKALNHNGSNTMNFCVMWLAPERDFSVVIMCNTVGPKAEKACDDAASAMIKKYLG
ncbi:MAG: Beta-lactamase [Verrucomicrobiales bacterium]|nr:Beta-lactamase [Verrucomicrobiales bacterium]